MTDHAAASLLLRLRAVFSPRIDAESFSDPAQGQSFVTNSTVLSCCALSMLLLMIVVNILEKRYGMCLPLGLTAGVCLFSLVFGRTPRLSLTGLVGMSFAFMGLAAYLLFSYPLSSHSKLFWILLFPPMLMLCLGLRYGTLLFCILLTFMCMSLFGPFSPYLTYDYPFGLRVRFVAALCGTWLFSALAEYSRHRTQTLLKQLLERLERDSLTDPLTGLGNRRDFQMFFDWAQAKSAREGNAFSLVMIDIDHFKAINDRYGHDVGDAVLRHTAKTMAARMRGGDRLFRWGGEEFIALMPETYSAEAHAAAERLRCGIEESTFTQGALSLTYTISLGVYCGHEKEAIKEQLEQVDALLYKAKRKGRNQVQSLLTTGKERILPLDGLSRPATRSHASED